MIKKQILITDDHSIVRKGVVGFLKENFPFYETEEAESAAETIEKVRNRQYDLLILDLNLPDANAEKFIKLVKREAGDTHLIVFSMFPANVMEKPMDKLGVSKYINKAEDLRKLKRAVEDVISGKVKTSPSDESPPQPQSPFASLSPKELSVMIALFDGKSNKEIADQQSLSPSTIATYKQRVLEKTQTKSFTDLLKVAIQFNVYSFASNS
jgi:DNA-binding NarL/FixJ family response regulator